MEKYGVFISVLHSDEYYSSDSWIKEGDKMILSTLKTLPGGSVSNASAVHASLGGKTYFYDVLSKSQNNDELLKDLKNIGVNTDYVERVDDLKDSKCLIILTGNERTILAIKNPKPTTVIKKEAEELFNNASFVYTASGWQYFISDCVGFAKKLKEKGVNLAVDCEGVFDDEDTKQFVENASILFFNEFGIADNKGELTDEEYLKYLFDKGVKNVVITLGKEGCRVVTPTEDIKVSAYDLTPVDTNGAGDTFNSSYLYALNQNMSYKEAAEFATAAAGRCILNMGARGGCTNEETVRQFMKENKKRQ